MFIYLISEKYNGSIIVGLTLLWSAIFSNNLLDVFMFGYIRDFINLHGVAVGNIADQYRNIGGVLIIAGLVTGSGKVHSYKTFAVAAALIVIFLFLIILFWKYLSPFWAT